MSYMDREKAIRDLVASMDGYLARFNGPGIADVRAGIARWRGGPLVDCPARSIPAVEHVETALDWMTANGEEEISSVIKAASPHLHWLAYDPYPRGLIGDRYAGKPCGGCHHR